MDGVAAIIDWAWAHHGGEAAWYARSVIVLALCYAAYKRSMLGVVAAALLLPASLVLTPALFEPRPAVAALLERQHETMVSANLFQVFIFVACLAGYLWLLAFAFWRRLILLGLFLINLFGFVRLAVFFSLWPEESVALVPPTLTTLLIIDAAIISAMVIERRRGDTDSAA